MKSTVYKDFFTNVSVAWFSAGVIAPLATSITNFRYSAIVISATMTLWFLFLAKYTERISK